MFTGIIESLGTIQRVEVLGTAQQKLTVNSGFDGVILGESIAINGVCLTVVDYQPDERCVAFDVSSETLACTSLGALQAGDVANLERAMLPTTRFGGHIVSGHVDIQASIASITPEDGFYTVTFELPKAYLRYVVKKGSIAVDGCSLTVNEVSDTGFSVMIIPHTWRHTRFHAYAVGSKVNIEVDMMARYVERLLHSGITAPLNKNNNENSEETFSTDRVLLADKQKV